jgi:hypothetical protein
MRMKRWQELVAHHCQQSTCLASFGEFSRHDLKGVVMTADRSVSNRINCPQHHGWRRNPAVNDGTVWERNQPSSLREQESKP